MRKSSAKAASGGKMWPRYVLAGCLATSALVVTANTIAMQDVAALTGAGEQSSDRWAVSLVSVPTGTSARKSQHRLNASSLAKADSSLAVKAGNETRIISDVEAPAAKKNLHIDRSFKGDRVVGIVPERFEIGGATAVLLQSRSLLLTKGLKHQYASPQIEKLRQLAHSFHKIPKAPLTQIAKADDVQTANRIASVDAKVIKEKPATLTGSIALSSDVVRDRVRTSSPSTSTVQRFAESPIAAHIRTSVMAAMVPAIEAPKIAKKKVIRPKHANRRVAASAATMVTSKGTDPLVAEYQQATNASLVTSYAPQEAKQNSPFDAVLRPTLPKGRPILDGMKKALSKFKIKLGKRDHKWALNPLPRNSYGAAQRRCLAVGIYFEARGEPVKGQQAVAQVILNRVKNPAYPRSICGVVYQNKWKRNRCQFSFACDGKRDRIRSKKHWRVAKKVANDAIEGKVWLKRVGSASHYHADYVRPRWRRKMSRRIKIGRHIFYRTYRGGWT